MFAIKKGKNDLEAKVKIEKILSFRQFRQNLFLVNYSSNFSPDFLCCVIYFNILSKHLFKAPC